MTFTEEKVRYLDNISASFTFCGYPFEFVKQLNQVY